MTQTTITASGLAQHIGRCGYSTALLAPNYPFGAETVPLAAFADTPRDVRSICIAAIDCASDPASAVEAIRPLGAPVVFSCTSGKLLWWKQTTGAPVRLAEPIAPAHVSNFFDKHKEDFAPSSIFEGKTLRRLPGQSQLSFVDVGLMPSVERASGEALSSLVERVIRNIEKSLGRRIRTPKDVNVAYQSTFWLLAAKFLHDKAVPNFINLKLADVDEVFRRVGMHYGDTNGLPPGGKNWRSAIEMAAGTINAFASLAHTSTDALAHVYENAMVPDEVRKANGIHSTPGPLVDYMIWQLWPWIEALPPDRRHVFEPACGHAAFLVGALRMLRQWSDISDPKARHAYLRDHLHGLEIDRFALEVARLSLTLADIPHGNTWDLTEQDMFVGSALERKTKNCGIFLANPPYERFSDSERRSYARTGVALSAYTKAYEMLRRTVPHLTPNACFGIVVPAGFLHGKEMADLRRTLLSDFELSEIDAFEDKLFERADHEAAVLLGRRKSNGTSRNRLWFRRVRNPGMEAFRDRFAFSSEEQVDTAHFAQSPLADLRIPELGSVWRILAANPRLASIATLGQGLIHHGENLPRGAWTIHDPPQTGDDLGFDNVSADLQIFALPSIVGINLRKNAIRRPVAGLSTGNPQVLLNYARVSREAWRLKATIDEDGHALTSRFIAVRPTQRSTTTVYLWALLNSPVANAFTHCHLGKRDHIVGTMRKMPLPRLSVAHTVRIEQAASHYRQLAASAGPLYNQSATPEGIKRALLDMDAAVLQAYDLPPRLEHQLLSCFWGIERKGVGCEFRGYYPPDSRPFEPLHVYLSDGFQQSTAGEIIRRHQPLQSEAALAAVDAFFELNTGD